MDKNLNLLTFRVSEFAGVVRRKKLLVLVMVLLGGTAVSLLSAVSSRNSQANVRAEDLENSVLAGNPDNESSGVAGNIDDTDSYLVTGFRIPRIALTLAGLPVEGVDLIYFPSPSALSEELKNEKLFFRGQKEIICTLEPTEVLLSIDCPAPGPSLRSVERVVNRVASDLHDLEVASVADYYQTIFSDDIPAEFRLATTILNEYVPLTVSKGVSVPPFNMNNAETNEGETESVSSTPAKVEPSIPQAPQITLRNMVLWFLGGATVALVSTLFGLVIWAGRSGRVFAKEALEIFYPDEAELTSIEPLVNGSNFESLRLKTLSAKSFDGKTPVVLFSENLDPRSLSEFRNVVTTIRDTQLVETNYDDVVEDLENLSDTAIVCGVKLCSSTKSEIRRILEVADLLDLRVVAYFVV